MAARGGEVGYDQLHHFVAAGVWDSAPLETVLLREADRLVGDDAGFLVIDDTALPKKGRHSVGVAPQYASSLGKTSNCQSLVSVTLASGEVPVMIGLRLFLPESWTSDPERMARAQVPIERRTLPPGLAPIRPWSARRSPWRSTPPATCACAPRSTSRGSKAAPFAIAARRRARRSRPATACCCGKALGAFRPAASPMSPNLSVRTPSLTARRSTAPR